ncbi:MAG: tetratricopeptide repeat protein [Planctomycetota bacterium]
MSDREAEIEHKFFPFHRIILAAVLITVVLFVVIATYRPGLSAQALFFDDDQYFTENSLVQNPGWVSARRFFTEVLEPSTVKGYYQPLTMISLMVDYALGGRSDNLYIFHRTSLTLHLANTAMVVVLLYLLFGRIWVAAAAGLLFGVHPMTVEPICWVSDRKTLLAMFFSLWCLICYIRFTRKGGYLLYAGCIVMYALALISKPTCITMPILMLLMDYWPLNRLRGRAVKEKLPFFIMAGVSAIIIYVSQSRTAAAVLPTHYNAQRIMLIVCHNIVFYLFKIVWPVNLSPHYAFPALLELSNPAILTGVIGSCMLIFLLVFSLRWTRAALTGWLFFFVAILPTMGVIGFTIVIAADKFVYLPSIGILMVLAAFLSYWFGVGTTSKTAIRYGGAVVIVLLMAAEIAATRQYLHYWRDTVSLFQRILALTPDAAPPIHYNLAVALQSEGKVDEAIIHYNKALQFKPDYTKLSAYGENMTRQSISAAHYNLGVAFQTKGRLNEAISHYREALKLKPNLAEAYNNLGNIFQSQGKFEQAIIHYRKALKFKPDHVNTHNNLAHIYYIQGKFDLAIVHLAEVVRLRPDSAGALNDLAWLLATVKDHKIRNPDESIRLARRACELSGYRQPRLLDTLAAAYASAGKFDEAVKTAEEAIALAAALEHNDLAEKIQKRIDLYKIKTPYVE